jgi:hypothetical protein
MDLRNPKPIIIIYVQTASVTASSKRKPHVVNYPNSETMDRNVSFPLSPQSYFRLVIITKKQVPNFLR